MSPCCVRIKCRSGLVRPKSACRLHEINVCEQDEEEDEEEQAVEEEKKEDEEEQAVTEAPQAKQVLEFSYWPTHQKL